MKVKKNDLIFTIVLFFLFFFSFLPDFDTLFGGLSSYLRMGAEGASLAYGIILIGRKGIKEGFLFFLIALQLQLLLAAFVNGTEWFPFVKRALHILSICILIKGACKKNTLAVLRSLIVVFLLFGLINLAYRIPNHEITHVIGTGGIYYLGSDNEAVSPMLLLFTVSLLYWALSGLNILSTVGMVLPIFTSFFSKSGTGMMAYTIFLVGFLIVQIPGVRTVIEKLSNGKAMVIAFGSYYFILWSVSVAKLTFLGTWISNITGKNAMTFTNRDVIWLEAINIVRNNPLFGIGYGEGAGGNGVYALGLYRGAHNTILQWGVNGGVLAIVFFVIALFFSFKRIEKVHFPLKYYLYLCCLTFLIAMSMENYSNGLHFLPMLAVINYSKIEEYESATSKTLLFGYNSRKRKGKKLRFTTNSNVRIIEGKQR